jgi:hypothetical protein
VRLRHNVGLLVMRREHETSGRLCRPCLGKAFRRHQLSNLVLGWWGVLSFVLTWVYLVDNCRVYFGAKKELARMAQRPGTARFVAEGSASERLLPFRHNVRLRLRRDEDAVRIAADLAQTHQVPLADAEAFVQELIDREFADAPQPAPL